jgi:hypothetical protein
MFQEDLRASRNILIVLRHIFLLTQFFDALAAFWGMGKRNKNELVALGLRYRQAQSNWVC